jgi:uncharacterized membrane protein YdjX (TVP38/TMEM64 family)
MTPKQKTIIILFVCFCALVFTGFALYLHSHSEMLKPENIQHFLEQSRESKWALPIVCLVFFGMGFILFPVTILSLVTSAVYGPILGPTYGMIGALVSASSMFWLGHAAGSRYLRELFGDRIRAIDQKFKKTGVIGIAILRFIPVAPFTLVNLAAGISSVKFSTFMVGTFIGFLPGLIAKGILGDSIVQMLIHPTLETTLYLLSGLALWIVLMYMTLTFVKWWRKNHRV